MCVYVHAKYEVSSTILTSFRQGVGDGNSPIPPPPPQNEPLKRLGSKAQLIVYTNAA